MLSDGFPVIENENCASLYTDVTQCILKDDAVWKSTLFRNNKVYSGLFMGLQPVWLQKESQNKLPHSEFTVYARRISI